MKYKEYRPNFVTGYKDLEFEFHTMDDLLSKECVATNFSKGDTFDHFSLSVTEFTHLMKDKILSLMAMTKDGKWYVTGYLEGTEEEIAALRLPPFKVGEA